MVKQYIISRYRETTLALDKNAVSLRGEEDMTVSDGYHTMDELYAHRIELFIALCRTLARESELAWKEGANREIYYRNGNIWRSKKHKDGSSFEGWFILGIRTDPSHQITYHLPIGKWDQCDFAFTLDKAPEWDGHTSADVLKRLGAL